MMTNLFMMSDLYGNKKLLLFYFNFSLSRFTQTDSELAYSEEAARLTAELQEAPDDDDDDYDYSAIPVPPDGGVSY